MADYEAYEDNAGGLYLFVFRGDLIYAHAGYEQVPGQLAEDIQRLKKGENPEKWEGCDENPDALYWEVTDREESGGAFLVADTEGEYPAVMGKAARKEFGFTDINLGFAS